MRKFKALIYVFTFFAFSSFVFAEDKCSDSKVEELKKQVTKVSIVSQYDEFNARYGVFNKYLVTVYELPKGFYISDKGKSVLFIYDEVKDGVVSKVVNYDIGDLHIYANECPEQSLKKFDLDLKKYNIYHDYEECKNIEEGELDVCDKFYDKDLTYNQFVKAVEKYKSQKDSNIITKNSSFIKDNIVTIGIVVGVLIVIVIIILAVINSKKNRLD